MSDRQKLAPETLLESLRVHTVSYENCWKVVAGLSILALGLPMVSVFGGPVAGDFKAPAWLLALALMTATYSWGSRAGWYGHLAYRTHMAFKEIDLDVADTRGSEREILVATLVAPAHADRVRSAINVLSSQARSTAKPGLLGRMKSAWEAGSAERRRPLPHRMLNTFAGLAHSEVPKLLTITRALLPLAASATLSVQLGAEINGMLAEEKLTALALSALIVFLAGSLIRACDFHIQLRASLVAALQLGSQGEPSPTDVIEPSARPGTEAQPQANG